MTFPPNPPSIHLLVFDGAYLLSISTRPHPSHYPAQRFNSDEKERLNWRGLADEPLDETCCRRRAPGCGCIICHECHMKILIKSKVSAVVRTTMGRTVNRAGRGSNKKEEEEKAGSQKHKPRKSFGEMSRLRQDH